jgi:beta-lactamase superfamily II metal-dependent hydrolase
LKSLLRKVVCVGSLLLLTCGLVAAQVLYIHQIDVGEGDSSLIVSPTGKTMLIDGGDVGMGNAKVRPYLASLGITHLDYVVLSHYHYDHMMGLQETLSALGTANYGPVYDRGTSPAPPTNSGYTNYAATVAPRRAATSLGQVIDLGGGVRMTCIARSGSVLNYGAISGTSGEDDLCLAWVLRFNKFKYYTGGDSGGEKTSDYVDLETPMAPDIGVVDAFKVDHHTSQYSTNQTFVNTLQPLVAVASLGTGNSYGFPTQTVLNRLASANCMIYLTETGSGGTIPNGHGWAANNNIVISTTGTSTFTVTFGSSSQTYTLHSYSTSGNQYNYYPTSVAINTGRLKGGDYTALGGDDSNYFSVTSFPNPGAQIVDWTATTTITQAAGTISNLSVTYKGRYSAGESQKLYLYDNYTSSWQQIDSRSVGVHDQTITWSPTSFPSDFVDAGGNIKLRVVATSPKMPYNCHANLVKFTITAP